MPVFTNQDEIDAYYLMDRPQPRAAAVLWPLLIEKRVDRLYEIALRSDDREFNMLFTPGGALSNYLVKVRFAYLLGWIEDDVFIDLKLIAKIRNLFAHSLEIKSFDNEKIKSHLGKMKSYNFIPGMLERAKERVKDIKENNKEDKNAIALASVLILQGALEDPVAGYRLCIDMMVNKLDMCAENMKTNLSKLDPGWMVGKDSIK